ncbi:C-terminal E3 ligase, LRR-interacting [Pseudomonas asplenii]|uniref:RING-type E3 ubiquitin transferase n=2 Tax=Pseudomonas asplenii TaxID=53407 RepID=A0A0M9GIG4_9PSED|nr:DUF6543 domain-containing protein [Pseudomonas fuscovaginae]KPA92012.1 C-terminal E3 ligase, LRR-interacting [Pseudomonas fuscovaginae]
MTTTASLTSGATPGAASPATQLSRHQAFIASRLPAPLKQRHSACLKPLLDIPPTTPAWYSQADASLRGAFEASQLARCASQHPFESLLGQITPLAAFAAPLLQLAIRQTFGLELDVRDTYFVRRLQTPRPARLGGLLDFSAGDPKVSGWYWDVTLLEAALHNFTADEAAKPPTEGDEFITRDHSTEQVRIAAYDRERALSLRPEQFATLCRQLDLGQRYQEHLHAVLNPADATQKAQVRQTWTTHLHNQLAEAVHLARMQAHIPDDAYQMLTHWLADGTDLRLGGHPVQPARLRMLGVDLDEVLFLRPDAGPSPRRCLVYLPNDDLHPLRHYDSSTDFMIDLRTRLHSARFRRFFARFIALREQPAFFSALKKRLDPGDRHELWDDYTVDPERRVGLDLIELYLPTDSRHSLPTLLREQCESRIERLLGDARALAVPTDDEDRQARIARFLGFADAAMDLLNLLVFIPGVGQVMLLAMGTRLLHEVYAGIEAWEAGETRQAWAQLLGVAMNLAFIGSAGVVLPHLDSSAFVDGLIPVSLRQGITRLWKPDLGPYRHPLQLPARSQPDRLGLHEYLDHQYLPLDDGYYQLHADPRRAGRYRARHGRAEELLHPYAPEFHSNGAGAWRHAFERPLGWSDARLFQRLGPEAARLDASAAQRVLHISGVDNDVLRALHHNHGRTPALLSDSVTRFALDRELAHLLQRLENGGNSGGTLDELHMELQLLTSDPVWPATRVLRLLDDAGRTLQEYPAGIDAQVPRIEVSWPQLEADDLLRQVLDPLDDSEIRLLLREEFGQGSTSLAARVAALRRRLAGAALKRRQDLFESHYRHRTAASRGEPGAALLQRDFPGLPDRLAEELARAADGNESKRLAAGRVPLRLAEEARYLLRNVRLARLYEPLYLDSVSQAEGHRLVLQMLGKLPGWSSQVRLEVRDRFFAGPLLDSLGPETAPIRKVLVRNGERYEAHDDQGQELHGADDLYASVLHALPDTQRQALGFPHVGQGAQLKQALRALPPLPRAELARHLSLPPIRPRWRSPLRLADGRVGYVLSGRGAGNGPGTSLVSRLARELYPNLSLAQVETLHGLRDLGQGAAIGRLRALQGEYRTLENELEAWVGEPQGTEGNGKLRFAVQLKRCWRHETDRAIDHEGDPIVLDHQGTRVPGHELTLTGYPLDSLPLLSGRFVHVAELHLRSITLQNSPSLERFLEAFPNLLRLNLSGNLLTRLPAALAHMSRLTHLELRNNQLVIPAAGTSPLSPLRHLQTLNLENNPDLGSLPDLRPLAALRFVNLRNTGLREIPQGYDRLPDLRRLDLRDNRISQVPDEVFGLSAARQQLNLSINLDANLIPADLHRRIARYRQQTGIDLGLEVLPESDDLSESSNNSRPHSQASQHHNRWGSASPVPRDSAPWLPGPDTAEHELRRDTWLRLASDDIEASEAFFKVLADLRNSADYLQGHGAHRPQLLDRVWRMVKAAEQDSSLRHRLYLMANRAVDTSGSMIEADTCEDGMTVTFDDMGLEVLLHEARALPLEQREEPLLRLARGKARLAQVKQRARQVIEARRNSQEAVHEAEIHLAFRIGLADRLDLPWQAGSMLYSQEANVDRATLEQASRAILAEERLPGEAARRLLEQPFWEEYLLERYGQTRLKEPREQRDDMIGALDDLLDAQREWFTGDALDLARKNALQQTISQSARTLGLTQTEAFLRAMSDSAYKSHAERIARTYQRALAQLTEQLRQQHGL